MARIRTIKPEMARHELLFELERETGMPMRFAWAVLPTVCDREGRFKWRPRPLKADVLPYDDLDFATVLDAFLEHGFLLKYRVGTDWFGCIPTFTKHQHINAKETDSTLPGPESANEQVVVSTREPRVTDALPDQDNSAPDGREGKGTGKGMEGNGGSAEPRRDSTPSPAVMVFSTVGEVQTWTLTEALVAKWQRAYPNLDIAQECRGAEAWLDAKPSRRKTARGMPAFLVNWFNTSVARGGSSRQQAVKPSPGQRPNYAEWECPHAKRCDTKFDCSRNTHKPLKRAEAV